MEEPSQFSKQHINSLTCSIMEKPHTELDDCLNMLLSCFRKRMSVNELSEGGRGAVKLYNDELSHFEF